MRPTVLSFTATGAVASQWVPTDIYVPNSVYGLQLTSTGQSCTVQYTLDDPYTTGTLNAYSVTATSLVTATGTAVAATVTTPARAFRLNPAGAGTFALTIVQQGTK